MSFAALRAVILVFIPMVGIQLASGDDDVNSHLSSGINELLHDLDSRTFEQDPASGKLTLKVGRSLRIPSHHALLDQCKVHHTPP